jgi:hypothetical protein
VERELYVGKLTDQSWTMTRFVRMQAIVEDVRNGAVDLVYTVEHLNGSDVICDRINFSG